MPPADVAPPPNAPIAPRLRLLATVCAVVVTALGLLALVAWFAGVQDSQALFPGRIVMKTNTAIGLLLLGLSLLLLAPETRGPLRTWAGRSCSVFAALIGLATLSQHLVGWNLGIDELLFREAPGSAATASPNRMGPPASVCFPLLAVALLLFDRRSRSIIAPFQSLALLAVLLAMVSILGYVFRVEQLYGIARYTGIALHTAIGFALLGVGILFARASVGVTWLLAADDSGGMLVRRLLPAAIVLPILLGWARVLGQEAGYYDVAFGRSLLVLSFVVAFSALTWWTAGAVSRSAHAKSRAEDAEARMRDRLVLALESERAARVAAEHSNRMKDEFLATLSHELRTPLHAIFGWAHLLARGGLSEADQRKGIESIERNARLQSQLVNDLLDMSGIARGKIRLELQNLALDDIVDAALATAAPAAEAKGIRIERTVEFLPPVHGDPARLHQVLWNLISNAIKFTPNGGRVAVTAARSGTHVAVAVSDTGMGIAPEALGQVFERFRQADSSITREHGGLGLGLSIARQLAELHGGSLEATSEGLGHGATFTLRLPAATPGPSREEPDPSGPADALAEGNGVPTSLEGLRVLVVEDQPDARELIERVLSERRAAVQSVANADEALRLLDHQGFDVIVSDLAMPDRDGFEFMRAVRARNDHSPAIALSAFARPQDGERAREAGYQLHLSKPIRPAELSEAVARLAGRGARAQQD